MSPSRAAVCPHTAPILLPSLVPPYDRLLKGQRANADSPHLLKSHYPPACPSLSPQVQDAFYARHVPTQLLLTCCRHHADPSQLPP